MLLEYQYHINNTLGGSNFTMTLKVSVTYSSTTFLHSFLPWHSVKAATNTKHISRDSPFCYLVLNFEQEMQTTVQSWQPEGATSSPTGRTSPLGTNGVCIHRVPQVPTPCSCCGARFHVPMALLCPSFLGLTEALASTRKHA